MERNGNGKSTPASMTRGHRTNYGIIDPATEMIRSPPTPTDPLLYDECLLFSTGAGDITPDGALIKTRLHRHRAGGQPGRQCRSTPGVPAIWRLDPFAGITKPDPETAPTGQLPTAAAVWISPCSSRARALRLGHRGQQRLWIVPANLNPRGWRSSTPATARWRTSTGKAPSSPPAGLAPPGRVRDRRGQQGPGLGCRLGPGPRRHALHPRPPTAVATTPGDVERLRLLQRHHAPSNTKMRRARGIAVDDEGFVWISAGHRHPAWATTPPPARSSSCLQRRHGRHQGVRRWNAQPAVDATSTFSKTASASASTRTRTSGSTTRPGT